VKRGDLAFTRQILGIDADQGDFGAAVLMEKLGMIANSAEAKISDVVRLNIYLANDSPELRRAAEKMVEHTWEKGKAPATTILPSQLPGEVPIACDAVIALNSSSEKVEPVLQDKARLRFKYDAMVAPAGRDILFASGRVGKGDSLKIAIAESMKFHKEDLAPLKINLADAIQVKAFIPDVTKWEEAEKLIESSFGEGGAPPIIFVQWSRENSVEIELVLATPEHIENEEGVSFFIAEGAKASPVYSRNGRLHGDHIIFFGGMTGKASTLPEMQVKSLFQGLKKKVAIVGSDMRHLVKATYFVSDNDVDKEVTPQRKVFYDPKRPPAASKISCASIGYENFGLLVDMIAVGKGK